MTTAIALPEPVRALHPDSGKPISIVGIDLSGIAPKLVALHKTVAGIWAEVLDDATLPAPGQ